MALDHAHPRGCAMAVGVLWAGWGTTAAPKDSCGPPQGQPHSHTPQGSINLVLGHRGPTSCTIKWHVGAVECWERTRGSWERTQDCWERKCCQDRTHASALECRETARGSWEENMGLVGEKKPPGGNNTCECCGVLGENKRQLEENKGVLGENAARRNHT